MFKSKKKKNSRFWFKNISFTFSVQLKVRNHGKSHNAGRYTPVLYSRLWRITHHQWEYKRERARSSGTYLLFVCAPSAAAAADDRTRARYAVTTRTDDCCRAKARFSVFTFVVLVYPGVPRFLFFVYYLVPPQTRMKPDGSALGPSNYNGIENETHWFVARVGEKKNIDVFRTPMFEAKIIDVFHPSLNFTDVSISYVYLSSMLWLTFLRNSIRMDEFLNVSFVNTVIDVIIYYNRGCKSLRDLARIIERSVIVVETISS